jgi:hypothetical protein
MHVLLMRVGAWWAPTWLPTMPEALAWPSGEADRGSWGVLLVTSQCSRRGRDHTRGVFFTQDLDVGSGESKTAPNPGAT